MRILVTGGAGFIGSHVVDAYIHAGHEVWVVDDLSRGKREQVNPHAKFIRMDLRSPDLKDLVAGGGFDCVNHHAAQMDVRVSVADPARDAMINILGTLNLLEAARAHGVRQVIFASTGGAIYGEQHRFPASEQHPTAPTSPYGVTKRAAELYLEYYRQVHGFCYIVLRYANVYGPRQDPDGEAGVVAIFCGKVLTGQRLIIFGDGEQTRDYVNVADVARANLLALNYLGAAVDCVESTPAVESGTCKQTARSALKDSRAQKLNTVFNIGTGIETSVNALAAILLEAADSDCPVVHHPARTGEQGRSVIDPSLAKSVLRWEPMISLQDGLAQTLGWFRSQQVVSNQRSAVKVGSAGPARQLVADG